MIGSSDHSGNCSDDLRAPRRIPRWAAWIGNLGAFLLRLLPSKVAAQVKGGVAPIGWLDYAPIRIRMAIDTPWQVYRLSSCAKEPETVAWLEKHVRPGDCVYDIGANVGAYSLVAAAISANRATVIALEPGFASYDVLCRNVLLNRAEAAIVPLPFALGERDAILRLRYSDVAAGAARHEWITATDGSTATMSTPVFSLDGLISDLGLPDPTLMKLDVDGPELAVLRGASKALADARLRSVLVELDGSQPDGRAAVTLLEELGFQVVSRHPRGDGALYNVIFERPAVSA